LSFEKIRYEAEDGIATITLDDPDTRNALGNQTLSELIEAFESARDDEAVRCVVLTSSHDKVFSAGGNLDQFAAEVPTVHKHFGTERFPRLFRLIGELGKPTICAANGHVLAGALGLALACDLIVAREGAGFGTPEINVGVFPFMIMALIYRNVPRKKTTEMLLLGERMTAEQALDAGIVNRVVPEEEFESAVHEWAAKLAGKSPVMMRLGKDAMFRQQDMAFLDALDYLRHNLTLALSTEDVVEGVQAFFEKREPQWKGR
jgi:enoyl-CoA hydratase